MCQKVCQISSCTCSLCENTIQEHSTCLVHGLSALFKLHHYLPSFVCLSFPSHQNNYKEHPHFPCSLSSSRIYSESICTITCIILVTTRVWKVFLFCVNAFVRLLEVAAFSLLGSSADGCSVMLLISLFSEKKKRQSSVNLSVGL